MKYMKKSPSNTCLVGSEISDATAVQETLAETLGQKYRDPSRQQQTSSVGARSELIPTCGKTRAALFARNILDPGFSPVYLRKLLSCAMHYAHPLAKQRSPGGCAVQLTAKSTLELKQAAFAHFFLCLFCDLFVVAQMTLAPRRF